MLIFITETNDEIRMGGYMKYCCSVEYINCHNLYGMINANAAKNYIGSPSENPNYRTLTLERTMTLDALFSSFMKPLCLWLCFPIFSSSV